MPHAGEICTEGGATEVIERGRERPPGGVSDDGFKLCKQTLTVGLSQRNDAHASGYPVRCHRMEKRMNRRRDRKSMGGTDQANGQGVDDRGFASIDQPIELGVMPGRARDLDERPALRRGLEVTFARGRKGRGEFGKLGQRRLVAR